MTCTAYRALAVAHQSWGAMLALLLVSLGAGWWAWSCAPRPHLLCGMPVESSAVAENRLHSRGSPWRPWHNPSFRRLLTVFMLNGLASAIPATLILFFVQDRLQASETIQAASLGIYFLSGALSMPVWLSLVRRIGLERSWLVGMVLSILVFLYATQLGAGDETLFLLVCALSGASLGSDLALPGALLAGLIAEAGDRGRADGTYFGWWNFASKLNLALAAWLALPLLGLLGYMPGTRDAQTLQFLTAAYCLLPCALKALAAAALYFLLIQPTAQPQKT